MDVTPLRLEDFGTTHFGTARLGNKSRTARLVKSFNTMMTHPGGTLPDKLNHPPDLRAFYGLVNQESVTHQAVLEPHFTRTRGLMRRCLETVLVIHDTTELDYTGLTSLSEELGQIGNGSHRGYLCHNSLAVVASNGEVLGLANQILYRRPVVKKGESRKARQKKTDRESRLWSQGSQAIGPAPEGRLWVDVCDRGSDLFEYLDHKHRQNGHYVVRSKHDRWIHVENDGVLQRCKLHAYARSLPERGRRIVAIPARDGAPARTATVRVGFAPIFIPAPKNPRGQHGKDRLTVWVVCAQEIDPPAGAKPLEWIILTNVRVETYDDAGERLDWYCRRWIIEEFHKGQKTGCGIETLQFTTLEAMEPAIAVLSVLAVVLLQLRCISRDETAKHRPARDIVPALFVEVLSCWRHGESRTDFTVHDFLYALARLGGHQNRKCDGPPGWLVLWRGWTKLNGMVEGAQIGRGRKHGKT
jgi:hypothetical protein